LNDWTLQHQNDRTRSLQREAHETLKLAGFPGV
jgi:hypothetical protein